MWLKILGLMMQQQGFRSPQCSLTVDTKAAVNSPTFPTTGPLKGWFYCIYKRVGSHVNRHDSK
ncbi:MAG: hypothetical protein EHM93_09000 [Bacteroidales bacterium]|nr:MAG: hypothetical protein EHM93_09000 [Bacteroidales bacterium]